MLLASSHEVSAPAFSARSAGPQAEMVEFWTTPITSAGCCSCAGGASHEKRPPLSRDGLSAAPRYLLLRRLAVRESARRASRLFAPASPLLRPISPIAWTNCGIGMR